MQILTIIATRVRISNIFVPFLVDTAMTGRQRYNSNTAKHALRLTPSPDSLYSESLDTTRNDRQQPP